MAIYEKPVRQLIREMVAGLGLESGQAFTRQQALEWFGRHYPKIKESTITCHLTRFSTNAPSRFHYNAKLGEEDLFFQIDRSRYRLYEPHSDPAPLAKGSKIADTPPPAELEEDDDQTTGEFAYENDLRAYLVKNLHLIEPGLRLYEEEDITGVNFPAGGRFIDILALDKSNNYVVIELKVSRGYDRVVGQLLRYVAWIEMNQADPGQTVRGVIVAREISEDLRLACSKVLGVALFEYEMSVSLKPVTTMMRAASRAPQPSLR